MQVWNRQECLHSGRLRSMNQLNAVVTSCMPSSDPTLNADMHVCLPNFA